MVPFQYECPYCGKRFGHYKSMKYHKSAKHPEEVMNEPVYIEYSHTYIDISKKRIAGKTGKTFKKM